MKRILIYLLTPLLLLLGASCEDRLDYPGGDIPEGISTFDVEVGFKNFTPALGSRAAGNAIKTIETLWVVIYDKDGNYFDHKKIETFTFKGTEDRPADPNRPSSETETGCAKFKLTIPNGWYKMYAVANFDLGKYNKEDIDTEEKLCSLSFEWSEPDPAKEGDDYTAAAKRNAQMLGYFKEGGKEASSPNAEDKEASEHKMVKAKAIAIRGNNTKIHAWLRRAASKLTIAFDTRKLNENIFIYIKSVTVKDIPKSCYLGKMNVPDDAKNLIDGEVIYFKDAKATDNYVASDYHRWAQIASGDSIYGLYSDKKIVSDATNSEYKDYDTRYNLEHSEEAPALYFYENMQGQGEEHTITDKRQDVSGNNNQISFPNGNRPGGEGWKDAKPYGTYVEVDAYYIHRDKPSQGPIKYRFMLGKDHKIDYDVNRNHHYMLTMRFNGNANDVDFHIDYEEEGKPGLLPQDEAYVSYLYNQQSMMSARIIPKKGYKPTKLTAVIVKNEWRPHLDENETAADLYYEDAWNEQMNSNGNFSNGSDANNSYYSESLKINLSDASLGEKCDPNCEFGFLSLRTTQKVTVEFSGQGDKNQVLRARNYYFRNKENLTTSIPKQLKDSDRPKGMREYTVFPDGDIDDKEVTNSNGDGSYFVSRSTKNPGKVNEEITYTFRIPLFTRAKTLDSWAVYTGTNVFYEHHRYARIKFIAEYKKIDNTVEGDDTYYEVKYTDVLQARRIDNPAGVYRKWDSNESFNVTLAYELLSGSFKAVESSGAWSAMIEKDPNKLVTLSCPGQPAVTGEGSMITGRTKTKINFTISPNSTPAKDDAYGAVILVRYHNNSCSHRIIVRQGYAAHQIGNSGQRWSAFNVYDGQNLTKSPLSVGSLFRRWSTIDYPILEKNNKRINEGFGIGDKPRGKYHIGKNLNGQVQADMEWDDIKATTPKEYFGDSFKLHNSIKNTDYDYKIPPFDDVWQLGIYDKDNKTHKEHEKDAADRNYIMGIFYADGATKTLMTADAYGYSDPDNEGLELEKGVRGICCYSLTNGDNVFFPCGALGHARRKQKYRPQGGQDDYYANGSLRYGSVDWKLVNTTNMLRPLAHNLPDQKGVSYWVRSPGDGNKQIAIDFNSGNYMTHYLGASDLYQGYDFTEKKEKEIIPNGINLSDALPIKPVIIETK